ncbi:MAG: arginine--tRNA ligase [Patescibacteria group bacterium]
MSQNIQKMIRDILAQEVGSDILFSVERSEIEAHGDYSSNIALVRAKLERKAPLEIAATIATRIKEKHSNIFHSVEAVPPGFLNFYLAPEFLRREILEFLKPAKKKNLGRACVEFISANPTGPLHVGNARSGPIGDVIANLLAWQGYKVTREYYHNDAGAQMGKLSATMWHWYLRACNKKSEFPEDGYPGDHLEIIARTAKKKFGTKLLTDKKGQTKLTEFTFGALEKENFATIKSMGIRFDRVVRESILAKTKTKKVLVELEHKGLLKKREGAIWFSPTEELETVVVKSDGTPIYFANDIAYHKEKFAKNDFVVDVFGENHEAHIPKLYAVADAFGFSRERLKIVVYGHVSLKEGEKVIAMSKRKGNFVTAEEVIKAVGADAFRFFMLEHAPRSSMQFDLKLAKAKSRENPVYYVQYAHARTSGILRKSKAKIDLKKADWSLLETMPEIRLMKQILAFTEAVDETVSDFETQWLTRYAYELARTFTHFYETTHVISEDKKLTASRLALVLLTRNTLQRISKLLGISAPEKM